jgi:ribonuclease P protein component
MIFASMKSSQVFNALFKQGRSFHTDAFVCFFQSAEANEAGFIASKKVGNAVARNFARRRLRELFRAEQNSLMGGRYAIVAKKPIVTKEFSLLKEQFSRAIKQVFKEKRPKV